jgi:hypothetical protein
VAAIHSQLERHHVSPQEEAFGDFFSAIKIASTISLLAIRPEVHQVITHDSDVTELPRLE